MLVYQSGQLPTTSAAALVLNALPYFYDWNRRGKVLSLVKGLAIALAAAAAHHVTLMFGAILFAIPVIILSVMDRNADGEERNAAAVILRGVIFAVIWSPVLRHRAGAVPHPTPLQPDQPDADSPRQP